MNNSSDNLNKKQPNVAINSIQRAVFVKRMSIAQYFSQDVYSYDIDNLYPDKCMSIAQRSGSLSTALATLSRFLKGQGFDKEESNKIIVNQEKNITLYDLLSFVSTEEAKIGFAIHIQYNRLGQIAKLTPVNFEQVRKVTRGKGYIITDWSQYEYSSYQNKVKFFVNEFDPENVKKEIKETGFDKYPGQLFYFKGTNDIYPLASFDSVLDDAQFDAESKLFSLSNIQNNFALDGIFKYPSFIQNNQELKDVKNKLENEATGAENAGRILTLGIPPKSDIANWKFFESFSRHSIDNLFQNQRIEAKKNIYELYQQPEVLNGRSSNGMFNQQSMQDAFEFYNGITQGERIQIERSLNEILSYSIWNTGELKIAPLSYGTQDSDPESNENEAIRAESQARLKGTVGGVQGILQIQQSVSQGTTQYDAGIEILKDIYGYEEDQARKILGEPIQEFDPEEETVEK